MIAMPSRRLFFALICLACLGLLGFGLYLEHVKGVEPCPLCVFQRIAFIAIALIAFAAAVHGPGRLWGRIYNGLIIVAAAAGAGIAGRQVWLQHLPPERVPDCGPGLDYLIETLPLGEALKMILTGSGECAEVKWRFLGLSIPEWSLAWFLLLILLCLTWIFIEKKAGPDTAGQTYADTP